MIEYANDFRGVFSSRADPKARKAHRCDECGRDILPGETYRYARGMAYDEFWQAKVCAHCMVAAKWLLTNCRGFLYHGILDDFEEHAEGRFGMLRIKVGARRKWASFADPSRLLPVPPYPRDMIETS
jgi:hypothetical protein